MHRMTKPQSRSVVSSTNRGVASFGNMTSKRCLNALLLSIVLYAFVFVVNGQTNQMENPAQQSTKISSAYECTQVSLNNTDSDLLTREERLALLDQSLSDSIDSYTSCIDTVQDAMSGGGSGGGQGGGAGSGGASAGGQSQGQSQANQSSESESSQQSQAGIEPAAPANTQQNPAERGVIAPKDNDSIICKLLFDEIQKSSGVSRAGLEKQYKEYMCGQ